MTGVAKPDNFQRFGIVGMVSLGNAYDSASRAVVRALQLPSSNGVGYFQSGENLLRILSVFRISVLSGVLAVFLFLLGASIPLPLFVISRELLSVFFGVLLLICGFFLFVERVSSHPKFNDVLSVFLVFLSVVGFLNFTVLEGHRSTA